VGIGGIKMAPGQANQRKTIRGGGANRLATPRINNGQF